MKDYFFRERNWVKWVGMAMVCFLAVFVWEALSDERVSVDGPHRVPVAVIDIAKVFKEHRAFAERMTGIKREIEDFERYVQARQTEIAGTKNDQPEKAAALLADLSKEIELKRKLFLEQEAVVYFEIYSEIESHAAQVCRDRDIGLLLRYNTDRMLKSDRASVLQGVNRAVVCCRVPDLTNDVLDIANAAR